MTSPIGISGKHNSSVPSGISFVWLDRCREDYEKFKQRFCRETGIDANDWSYFNNDNDCGRTIGGTHDKRVVLVSSARLGSKMIEQLHDINQLSSIYIYCSNKQENELWAQAFHKIRGVHSDPIEMFYKIRQNLDDEARRSSDTIAARQDGISQPSRFVESRIDRFAQPETRWCPWQTNSCTKSLAVKGQGTIEIIQSEPIPFKLFVSNKRDPNDRSAFGIILEMSVEEASLGVINDGEFRALDRTTETHQVLQSHAERWHTYWISFSKDDSSVKFGSGEIRPKFTILEATLSEADNQLLQSVQYLHIKINNKTDIEEMSSLRSKFRFMIGSDAVIFEPALFIVPHSQSTLDHASKRSALTPSHLEVPCRHLYYSVISFSLDDGSFPDFVSAIEHSVKSPTGWCYQKLREKANRFGRPNIAATYLRITVGERKDRAPDQTSIIEIWPPGHYSPIHNHGNAYGIIRVLYGKILIKLFPTLSLNPRHNPLIEQILDEGQVTWMLPNLNQTHQVRNVDNYGSSCITFQCYQYGQNNQIRYEYFDYITNDGHRIQQCEPKSDMDYNAFKELMRKEWEDRLTH